MYSGGVQYLQPPTINSSLLMDKVLVGETVMLNCNIHLLTDVGVAMSWNSVSGSQVNRFMFLLHH